MAIFTALASFILTGTFVATGFGVSLLAAGIGIATIAGISYVQKALAGNPNQESKPEAQGVQGKLNVGGDVPRSFQLGYSVTAGSLVYANTWGQAGNTPNAFFTQVIALSDLPVGSLVEFWVNGELCTIAGTDGGMGRPVTEYNKTYPIGPIDHLWVRFYDGTQTTADPFLVASVSSAERPYQSTRVGYGVAYAIVTAMVDDTLFTGFPQFKFAVSGVKLYDPTKDSTNGGSGSHRWTDKTTWGGDGDNLPAVQLYNILRGITYGSSWLYGLQLMTAARLPNVNWNAQINKCRATITGTAGLEPTYRSGGQVYVNVPPLDTVEALLTACQGRLSEIGGFYKIHLGAPDSSTFSFTDADILSTEEQEFAPFFGLADSINGVAARYPSPAEGWNIKAAPPLFDAGFEAQDGNRRLLASPSLDFVPYDAQAQRLQKSGLQEARRARRHTISMGPAWWIVEPGDFGNWTSVRNGYSNKQFRIDGVTDRAELDVGWTITEVDPTDYSWNHATDYRGVSIGPTEFPRPAPQGVVDWYAEPWTLYDDTGTGRRAAIRLAWDGTLPGIVGVQWEARNGPSHPTAPGLVVNRGRTDQVAAGAIIISQNLVSNTAYEVRGQYIPSSPRDMLWSSWLSVTTPNVDSTIDAYVRAQVTFIENYLNDEVAYGMQLIASTASNSMANTWLDNQEIRTELKVTADKASASITSLEQVRVNDQVAFAQYQQTVSAQFASTNASVTVNSSAIATLNGYAAAQYSVTLDANGYATGFVLFNGGSGVSTATFVQEKFQIAAPGVGGGAPVPIFTVANVTIGGTPTPKIAIRGDMYADGTIYADALVTGTITSASGKIGALSVDSISIADAAITVPAVQTLTANENPGALRTVNSVTLAINTAGLSGKTIYVMAAWVGAVGYSGTGAAPTATLVINGSNVQTIAVTNSQDGFMSLAGSASFVASGGTDNIGVSVGYAAAATGTPVLQQRTLWAMAAKR